MQDNLVCKQSDLYITLKGIVWWK